MALAASFCLGGRGMMDGLAAGGGAGGRPGGAGNWLSTSGRFDPVVALSALAAVIYKLGW